MKIVLTTLPTNNASSPDLFKTFSADLVRNKLAACVNSFPHLESTYYWKSKVTHDSECMLIIKTSDDKINELEAYLIKNHPYKVFEFIVLEPSSVGEAYANYLNSYLSN